MARLRRVEASADQGLRERLQASNADRLARYGKIPGNPWARLAADLATGKPVTVRGWQLAGAEGVKRAGLYTLDASGTIAPATLHQS